MLSPEFVLTLALKSDLVDSSIGVSTALATTSNMVDDSELVGIRDSSFTWNPAGVENRFRLSVEGELIFPRGQISLIVGQTGSGKTSMLMALLGEMYYHPINEGSFVKLPRGRGVAYQAQESWIMNETIQVWS
jgi:ABC-type multidrug transport system fused ATPase/permease subunit